MEKEPFSIPEAIVMGAGTGGTSVAIGRHILYKDFNTKLMVVNPENSVFYQSYISGDNTLINNESSRIEGIGRPKVESSFQPDVIDQVMQVPDAASVAAILWLEKLIGRKAGASTRTNLWGALCLAEQMHTTGQSKSIVTLVCDSSNRYLDTYYNPEWVAEHIGAIQPSIDRLNTWFDK